MHTIHSKRIWHFLLTVSLIALFLGSGLAFFGHLHWTIDLLTHFRLQYLLGFLILIGLFALSKRPVYVSLATFGLLLSIVTLLPFYFQPAATATLYQSTQQTTVMLSNINYGNTDHARLLQLIEMNKPDVVVVVEALPADQQKLSESLNRTYPFQFTAEGRNGMGVAVFSSQPFAQSPQTYYWADKRHPAVLVQIGESENEHLALLAMHPPPPLTQEYSQIRNAMFAGAAEYAKRVDTPLAVVGDFNSTSWSPHFQTLMEEGRLSDSRLDKGLQTSWPSQLPAPLRISIDHVLINRSVQVLERAVLTDVGSDHLPILATLAW